MEKIATFFTHLGALRYERKLKKLGDDTACMSPVPRKLSASCGTCVRFHIDFQEEWADEDLEAVYQVDGSKYICLFENEEE